MRIFINVLSLSILVGIVVGFLIKRNDILLGDRIVGISILAGAFILMPAFLVYRSRGKKFKDYMLTNDNLKKMKEHQKNKRENDRKMNN